MRAPLEDRLETVICKLRERAFIGEVYFSAFDWPKAYRRRLERLERFRIRQLPPDPRKEPWTVSLDEIDEATRFAFMLGCMSMDDRTAYVMGLREAVEAAAKQNAEWSAELATLRASLAAAQTALAKINDIRNSIIGLQTVNWSEHVYPLISALNEAEIKGMDYPDAKARFGTMLERTNVAESSLAAAREREQRLEEACRECLKVAEDCYEVTGHFHVAKTSRQRMKIESLLALAEPGADGGGR